MRYEPSRTLTQNEGAVAWPFDSGGGPQDAPRGPYLKIFPCFQCELLLFAICSTRVQMKIYRRLNGQDVQRVTGESPVWFGIPTVSLNREVRNEASEGIPSDDATTTIRAGE